MSASRPIRPDEVSERKTSLPDTVFDVFNQLIVDHFDGVKATFTQNLVVDRLISQLGAGTTRRAIFDLHYLDIEFAYREAGWEVVYDKPGFNESYDATFTFSRPTKQP